jgi:hypothetical protein
VQILEFFNWKFSDNTNNGISIWVYFSISDKSMHKCMHLKIHLADKTAKMLKTLKIKTNHYFSNSSPCLLHCLLQTPSTFCHHFGFSRQPVYWATPPLFCHHLLQSRINFKKYYSFIKKNSKISVLK